MENGIVKVESEKKLENLNNDVAKEIVQEARDEKTQPLQKLRRKLFEDKLYLCEDCGKQNVRKKIGSPYTPKYCVRCRQKRRITAMQNARAKHKKKLDIQAEGEQTEKSAVARPYLIGPDGFPVYFTTEEEKGLYQNRWDNYKTDFDWTASSDGGMLARLLTLEVEMYRLQQKMFIKQTAQELEIMSKLTQEYRQVQHALGIDRLQRLAEMDKGSAQELLNDMINKFKAYKTAHPERFRWQCKYCGKVNTLDQINETKPKDGTKTTN